MKTIPQRGGRRPASEEELFSKREAVRFPALMLKRVAAVYDLA